VSESAGCNGTGNVNKLAEIIGATGMEGEISLMSSVILGNWVSSKILRVEIYKSS
jgi:hydroxymethylglutaryl-CoA reductase (NADPH)